MSVAQFDTLRFSQTLREGDFAQKQIDALTRAFTDISVDADLAKRSDLRDLETSMKARFDTLETKLDARFAALEANTKAIVAESRNTTIVWLMATLIALLIAVGSLGTFAFNVGRAQVPTAHIAAPTRM